MPTIFELFGFPVKDRSRTTEELRKFALCPFMETTCDGGGNRHQTKIRLHSSEPLRQYFHENLDSVIPGICSIITGSNTWVVCPRRLFAARKIGETLPTANFALQSHERAILLHTKLPRGVDIGIWSEVYLKQQIDDAQINYHFDYIVVPLANVTLSRFLQQFDLDPDSYQQELTNFSSQLRKINYFPKNVRNASDISLQLPMMEMPYIFEIMTASTSGSDTGNATDIRSAFRNAILSQSHVSPGINKRQVWGRMVTQLFAKTALAQHWGGQALWIIQDELLQNIELTTLLHVDAIARQEERDIHLVVMSYEDDLTGSKQIELQKRISADSGLEFLGNNTFTDILLPKITPAKIELARAILRRPMDAVVRL